VTHPESSIYKRCIIPPLAKKRELGGTNAQHTAAGSVPNPVVNISQKKEAVKGNNERLLPFKKMSNNVKSANPYGS
jgi:hypothetical protein